MSNKVKRGDVLLTSVANGINSVTVTRVEGDIAHYTWDVDPAASGQVHVNDVGEINDIRDHVNWRFVRAVAAGEAAEPSGEECFCGDRIYRDGSVWLHYGGRRRCYPLHRDRSDAQLRARPAGD